MGARIIVQRGIILTKKEDVWALIRLSWWGSHTAEQYRAWGEWRNDRFGIISGLGGSKVKTVVEETKLALGGSDRALDASCPREVRSENHTQVLDMKLDLKGSGYRQESSLGGVEGEALALDPVIYIID